MFMIYLTKCVTIIYVTHIINFDIFRSNSHQCYWKKFALKGSSILQACTLIFLIFHWHTISILEFRPFCFHKLSCFTGCRWESERKKEKQNFDLRRWTSWMGIAMWGEPRVVMGLITAMLIFKQRSSFIAFPLAKGFCSLLWPLIKVIECDQNALPFLTPVCRNGITMHLKRGTSQGCVPQSRNGQ